LSANVCLVVGLNNSQPLATAVALVNFGWLGGASEFFRQRQNLAAQGFTAE